MKHIIWDWNGTILDDAKLGWSIMAEMQKDRGIKPFTFDDYKNTLSFPIIEYYKKAGLDLNKESFESLSKIFIKEYGENWNKCNLNDGIVEVLEYLNKNNITCSILSASEKSWLAAQTTYYNVDNYFTLITGRDDYYAAGKKDLIEKHISKLGMTDNINDIVYIGDTIHDYEVSLSIGCKCILCSFGHQDYERLLTCGCDVVHTAKEIIPIIKNH